MRPPRRRSMKPRLCVKRQWSSRRRLFMCRRRSWISDFNIVTIGIILTTGMIITGTTAATAGKRNNFGGGFGCGR